MLGNMRIVQKGSPGVHLPWLAVPLLLAGRGVLPAQTPGCVTQARMTAAQRSEIGAAAYKLASAVQNNEAARVQAESEAGLAGDPSQIEYLVRSTAAQITGDQLRVTDAFLLDASSRPANESAPAEFSCPLEGSVAEVDFAISGLPPGRYAFAVVEAEGGAPWTLAFLLQNKGTVWRMAGFYPHARSVAGHDGLWFWTTARTDARENRPWLAWLLFGEADRLLRPANFLISTNLEKLRTEQRTAAPQPLSNGLSAETPLSLQAAGAVYAVTSLEARGSDDGKTLNLVMHLAPGSVAGDTEAKDRSLRAAEALLSAHPELRPAFANVEVVTEAPGSNPVVWTRAMAEIQPGSRKSSP